MTLRSLSLAGAFVLAATLVAHAADITGKWTAQVPGRDGQTRETTFDFKVDGEKLTGTTTGRNGDVAITDGTVKGDAVAFTVVDNFQGNEVKILYKGTVAGDEIKFTRQREGGDRLRPSSWPRRPSSRSPRAAPPARLAPAAAARSRGCRGGPGAVLPLDLQHLVGVEARHRHRRPPAPRRHRQIAPSATARTRRTIPGSSTRMSRIAIGAKYAVS